MSITLRTPLPQLDLVEGAWLSPSVALPGVLADPNTGEPRQPQVASSPEVVERALHAADRLHRDSRGAFASLDVRRLLLDLIAEGLEARENEIAYEDSLANGNPVATSRLMAAALAPRVRSARDQLAEVGEETQLPADDRTVRLLRRPLGPAAVLAPWNAPTFVAVAKLASALAAGCPVLLKPSEWAPAGCQIAAEVVTAAARRLDMPPAVFQVVHGAAEVGNQIAHDPRIRAISFTGGGPGGRAVAAAAAPHFTALQLELGGHNPAIVLADADIAATAKALAEGVTRLNGQWCEAPGKVLVPPAMHDELVEALADQLASRRVGHCLAPETEVGPLAYAQHRDRLQSLVDQLRNRGGKVLSRSEVPDLGGWFFAPTVVAGLPASASDDELFGPVLTVHPVTSVDEALDAAAGPQTGLAGFVFGRDEETALSVAARIPAGEVRINGCHLADLADGSEQDFWNSAGYGGHGPTDMVRFFQGRRIIGVDDPTAAI